MCGTTEYTCEGSSSFKERLPGVQSPQRISEVRRPHWAGKLTLKKAMTSAGLSEFSFSWNTSFNVENRVLSSMTFSQVGSLSTVGRRDSRGMTAIKTLVVRYAVIPSSQENQPLWNGREPGNDEENVTLLRSQQQHLRLLASDGLISKVWCVSM